MRDEEQYMRNLMQEEEILKQKLREIELSRTAKDREAMKWEDLRAYWHQDYLEERARERRNRVLLYQEELATQKVCARPIGFCPVV